MKNIEGVFTLQRRKAFKNQKGEWEAGEVIEEVTQQNNLSDANFQYFVRNQSSPTYYSVSNTNNFIWVSRRPWTRWGSHFYYQNNGTYNKNYEYLYIRDTVVENDKWIAASGAQDGYYQFRQRFNPPSEDVDIRSVGFGATAVSQLQVPFTQTTTDILDVTYRIIVRAVDLSFRADKGIGSYAAESINKVIAYRIGQSLSGGMGAYFWNNIGITSYVPTQYPLKTWPYRTDLGNTPLIWTNVATPFWGPYSQEDGVFSESTSNTSLTSSVGVAYAGWFPMGYVNLDGGFVYSEPEFLLPASATKVQNTFGKNTSSDQAWLDIDNQATGLGTYLLDDNDGWTKSDGPLRKYRVHITSGGATGVAEYKLRAKYFASVKETSFENWGTVIPGAYVSEFSTSTSPLRDKNLESPGGHGMNFALSNNSFSYIHYGVTTTDFHFQKYILPEIIFANSTGITIGHLNKPFQNIDTYSPIPLTVTDIQQIDHLGNGTILVACAETGLWKIERTLDGDNNDNGVTAITRVTATNANDDTKCRGIQVRSSNGDWWALFDNELCKSSNGGSTWTVYNASSGNFVLTGVTDTPGNENRVQAVILDKEYATEDRFFFPISATGAGQSRSGGGSFWSVQGSTSASDEVYIGSSYVCVGKLHASVGNKFLTTIRQLVSVDPTKTTNLTGANFFCAAWNWGNTSAVMATNGYDRAVMGNTPDNWVDSDGTEWVLGLPVTSGVGGDGINDQADFAKYDVSTWTTADAVRIKKEGDGLNQALLSKTNASGNGASLLHKGPIGQGLHLWGEKALVYYAGADDESTGGFTDQGVKDGFWEEYGWNGTNWEIGNPNSKTTHSTRQPLIDGLSVTFTGTDSQSWVATEYYDSYVINAILKDNATEINGITVRWELYPAIEVSTFSSATVPSSDLGTLTNEPVAIADYDIYTEDATYSNNHSVAAAYSKTSTSQTPGQKYYQRGVIPLKMYNDRYDSAGIVCQEQMTGNFEVNFKCRDFYENDTYGMFIGVRQVIDNDTRINGATDALIPEVFRISKTWNSAYGNADITLTARNGTGGYIYSSSVTDFDEVNDVITIARTGDTLTYARNGTVFYTNPNTITNSIPLQIVASDKRYKSNKFMGATCEDITATYTDNRRIVRIGDSGASTGYYDPDLRKVVTHEYIRDKYNSLTIDGSPAAINYDLVAPGPGEATLLPYSASLWFNSADAGKTIAGSFGYFKTLNPSDPGATGAVSLNEYEVTFSGGVFSIDGVAQPTINLQRGARYYFRQDDPSNSGEPFYVSSLPDGRAPVTGDIVYWYDGSSYSGTSGTAGAYRTLLISDTPGYSKLYYFSNTTTNAGGVINII